MAALVAVSFTGCASVMKFNKTATVINPIVAEKSANSIISVIGILFPLFASVVGGVSSSQAIIFTLNLTCAVITLGLIWIPQNDTKAIEIISDIDTELLPSIS